MLCGQARYLWAIRNLTSFLTLDQTGSMFKVFNVNIQTKKGTSINFPMYGAEEFEEDDDFEDDFEEDFEDDFEDDFDDHIEF